MPRFDCVKSSPVERTPRVRQLEGMFDLPATRVSTVRWSGSLPIEEREWNIGLIVGPSGCGKSTLARELFGSALVTGYDWSASQSVVDGFPEKMTIREISRLLSSVGFSSPPNWLRPFGILSNGEQFRVTVARALAEQPELAVIDEFTSVVDRTVARIGSAAVARTVRSTGKRLVAVACHYDIIDWLQPDWIYEPHTDQFDWRSLRRRPEIELEIRRVDPDAWKIFAPHHYLNHSQHRGATSFCAFLDDRPVAFDSWLPFVGKRKQSDPRPIRRTHRNVCLPDYQGVGIGNALNETIASLWVALGNRALLTSSHPAKIQSLAASKHWKMIRKPSLTFRDEGGISRLQQYRAASRFTSTFEYIGPPMERTQAEELQRKSPQGRGEPLLTLSRVKRQIKAARKRR